jgi:glycosyltransferase involved in cell wall biosynthesis
MHAAESKADRKLKFVGLTLGDPFSPSSRSGVNYNVFSRLQQRSELVDVFDLDLQGARKAWLALASFSPNRRRWGNKLHQSPRAFRVRTCTAERKLHDLESRYDLIYQDGAMFLPGQDTRVPFVTYHDSNVVLSSRGGVWAHGAHYRGKTLRDTIAQETLVYQRASLIFAMSDWLKKSLIRDFHVAPDKIVTTYAGTNLRSEPFEKSYDGRTILFVGNDFERKGGPVLLEAFQAVKKEVKEARLIVVGPNVDIRQDGVEVKGRVADATELAKLFRDASLFVLPSAFEPFGIVFLEAFAFKNPCIGTDVCAMPEIVEEGKGGFLVPRNDPAALADRMLLLLRDEPLSRKMGHYGYEKVRKIFNWDQVVDTMISHCSRIV